MKKFLLLCALAFSVFLVIFLLKNDQGGLAVVDDKPQLVATTYPLAFVADRLLGDEVSVTQLLPSNADPHSFAPRPSDLQLLQNADVILANGAGIDTWLDTVSSSIKKSPDAILRASDLIELLPAEEHEDEHEEEDHDHGDLDPHFWLDPLFLARFADSLATELIQRFPASQDKIQTNQASLSTDLRHLDETYRIGLSSCRLDSIVVAHDAFQYLAASYAIKLVPIAGISPQDEPSVRRLAEIAQVASERQVNTIFFEETVSPRLSQAIADEIGARTEVFHTIENRTADQVQNGQDYFSLMAENLMQLQGALDCSE